MVKGSRKAGCRIPKGLSDPQNGGIGDFADDGRDFIENQIERRRIDNNSGQWRSPRAGDSKDGEVEIAGH